MCVPTVVTMAARSLMDPKATLTLPRLLPRIDATATGGVPLATSTTSTTTSSAAAAAVFFALTPAVGARKVRQRSSHRRCCIPRALGRLPLLRTTARRRWLFVALPLAVLPLWYDVT